MHALPVFDLSNFPQREVQVVKPMRYSRRRQQIHIKRHQMNEKRGLPSVFYRFIAQPRILMGISQNPVPQKHAVVGTADDRLALVYVHSAHLYLMSGLPPRTVFRRIYSVRPNQCAKVITQRHQYKEHERRRKTTVQRDAPGGPRRYHRMGYEQREYRGQPLQYQPGA